MAPTAPLPANLPSGGELLPFDPGEHFRWDVVRPIGVAGEPEGDPDVLVRAALDRPIGSPPVERLVGPTGGRVVIAVPDATRAAGVERILPVLLQRLETSGIEPEQVTILFATGIHRPVTLDEQREILGRRVADRFATVNHDAGDSGDFVSVGPSSAGTPIRLNRSFVEADLRILIGAVGLHYFAGFTGGRKSVLPGLASRETIFANHLKVLGGEDGLRHPAVRPARLVGNPVNEEMEEAAALAGVDFIINTILDDHGRISAVFAGHWREAHRAACERVRATCTVAVDSRRRLVLASAGGHPKDINMIQAHKAMEYAVAALEEGGVLLLVAACAEGPGHPDFFPWFAHRRDVGQMAARLRRHYQVYGQTALALTAKARRFRVGLVSGMADELVETMGMTPMKSLDQGLGWAAGQLPRGTPAWVIPHAGAVLPRPAGTGQEEER